MLATCTHLVIGWATRCLGYNHGDVVAGGLEYRHGVMMVSCHQTVTIHLHHIDTGCIKNTPHHTHNNNNNNKSKFNNSAFISKANHSRMCAFHSIWSCPFKKDGGNTIQSAKNHMLYANLMALCVIEPELWLTEDLHCGDRDFGRFLLLWPWPYDLHIWTWPIFLGYNGWEKTFYIKAFKIYRLTERHT